MNVDVLIKDGGSIYRFATEELLGESTPEGWRCEHYSLTVERVDAVHPGSQLTDLTGVVIDAEVVVCDEWLGPVETLQPSERAHGRSSTARLARARPAQRLQPSRAAWCFEVRIGAC